MADITIAFPEFSSQQKHQFWKLVDKSTGQGPNGECWEWKGTRVKGYGKFRCKELFGRQVPRAHRAAYFLVTGIDPDLQVLHHCDNPPCCNPAHLFLGTHADNVRDMHAKGRGYKRPKMIGPRRPPTRYFSPKATPEVRVVLRSKTGPPITADPARYRTISKHGKGIGEKHPNAKLTKEQVLAIRYFHDVLGVGRGLLAKQYGVHRASIRDIVWRRSWTHV